MEDGFRPEADEHDYSPQAIDLAEACGGMQDCPCCYVHLGSASHMANQELPAFGMTSVPPTLEPSKILDIIGTKQTQYYALWAVYTAVQFSAATYGIGKTLSWSVAIAVLAGFWIFNLGHLGFVLQCVRQLDRLQQLLLLSASAD